MKKITLFSIALIFLSLSVQAQKKNAIKTNLFSPIIRTGHILYERVINDDMSFQLGFFYTGYTDRDTDASLKGWGITPEFRYYLSESSAPAGFYLAPSLRYMSLTAEEPIYDDSATLTSFGIAINLGGQWLFKDVIILDVFVGPSYNFRNLESTVDDYEAPINGVNGFGIRGGVVLGVAF